MLSPVVLCILFSAPAGALADRIGPRLQMILGPIIVALGVALLTIGGADASYLRHFLPGLMLIGTGMGLVIVPLTKSALAVEPRFYRSVSGINNTVSRTAGLMAVAVLGAIVVSTFTPYLNDAISTSGLAQEKQRQILGQSNKLGGINIPDTFDETARVVARDAIIQSFIYGFRWAMGVSAALALISGLVPTVTIHGPPHRRVSGPNTFWRRSDAVKREE